MAVITLKFGGRMTQIQLTVLLLFTVLDASKSEEIHTEFERHPNDGWYNNLIHPDWGAIDTHLLRRSPTQYSDGVYEPSGKDRPNPLEISKMAFKGNNTLSSARNRNALMVFFGQQLVEEIMDAQRPGCPIEYFNIPVPKDHDYNTRHLDDLEMPFLRARYNQRTGFSSNNPRQQLNEITPFLDGNLVYGAGKAVEDALRAFKDGLLLSDNDDVEQSFPVKNDIRLPLANPPSPRDHILRPVNRFRRFGNPRTHENPFLMAMGVIWFRYHNYLAKDYKTKYPGLNDEQLFNLARKRSIAQYQKIVMYEWLPPWLAVYSNETTFDLSRYPYEGGQLNPYKGYDPNVHPGISTEFQTAALRFGHTLVPEGIIPKDVKNGVCEDHERSVEPKFTNDKSRSEAKVKGIRLCNAYWVPQETVEGKGNMDRLMRGLVYTKATLEDNIIVTDLREDVFGTLDWSRRDLGALNIQRGRDHGLPGYNDVREAYGLERVTNWSDINSDLTGVLDDLKRLYGNPDAPDNLDLFVGGLLETTHDGPGELFRAITLDQFLRIRHGDRFWYENEKNGLFNESEIAEINTTTMLDVLLNVTGAFGGIDAPSNTNVFFCANTTGSIPSCLCSEPDLKNQDVFEVCTPLQHYDYFSGSEVAFVVTIVAIGLSLPVTIGVMCALSKLRKNSLDAKPSTAQSKRQDGDKYFHATEWVGRTNYGLLNSREVKVQLDDQRMKILVSSLRGQVVRMIDLRRRTNASNQSHRASMTRSSDKGRKLLIMSVPGEIDLVLHFPSTAARDASTEKLEAFFKKHSWTTHEGPAMSENVLWREAMTVDQRKELLAKFFKSALAEMPGSDSPSRDAEAEGEDEILTTQLTRTEFAEALGLQPQSLFVRNMFLLVDSTGDGFVSFDEFKAYFGILSQGDPEQKAKMFFQMFDTSRTGRLSKDNYKKMIQSLVELNEAKNTLDINSMVDTVFQKLGRQSTGYLTFDDFKKIMFSEREVWKDAVFNLEVAGETTKIGKSRATTMRQRASSFVNGYAKKGARPTSMVDFGDVPLPARQEKPPKTKFEKVTQTFSRYVDNHRRQIFWLTLYTFISIGIFIERAYYYSVEREHAGLRRMAGYGVSVTRGAASGQMFTYASLLVTMSRNTLTFFRGTFLHQFIPFDNAHDMHLIIAGMAMFFTVMHVIGHVINFYHISTQASSDLNCYFREFFRPTHVLASFQYWTYTTITGLTGIALVLVLVVMYVFAMPWARRNVFKFFRTTHNLYIVVYFLMFLHGGARLVQPPLWPWFFIGPLIVFVLDKLVSVSRNKVLLPVIKATLLPSGVINLVFKRPQTFDYQSGQWVRIACPALDAGEYHPFTLTSSPHEDRLSLHIRAVGPWTNNLRRLFEQNAGEVSEYPRIYLDGPFGESHQDWFRYPVAVLVGGGIGVTPFASILKDIAHRSKEVARLPCQKVYFVWVTRTQQSFEWMTEIIRQVELADTEGFVEVKICITQMKEQYDLRTTMLYICERHFQKIAGVSMFTGLRAKTHFGRPKFPSFFEGLKTLHKNVGQIGVFSCGPPAMTRTVEAACTDLNAYTGPSLIHHYENF